MEPQGKTGAPKVSTDTDGQDSVRPCVPWSAAAACCDPPAVGCARLRRHRCPPYNPAAPRGSPDVTGLLDAMGCGRSLLRRVRAALTGSKLRPAVVALEDATQGGVRRLRGGAVEAVGSLIADKAGHHAGSLYNVPAAGALYSTGAAAQTRRGARCSRALSRRPRTRRRPAPPPSRASRTRQTRALGAGRGGGWRGGRVAISAG
jgi:hypothetical protein